MLRQKLNTMIKKASLLACISLFFLVSFGQNITLNWSKSLGGTGEDRGNAMTIDSKGNIYTTGNFKETVDFDTGPDEFILTSKGEDDIYVQKSDINGNLIWAISFGSEYTLDYGESIVVDDEDNIYVTGSFQGTIDFDPNENIMNLTSNGGSDIFILKLDPLGNLLWAKNFGGSGYEYSNHINVDNLGCIYACGSINSGNIDFDLGEGTCYLSSNNGPIFILKLDSSGGFLWAKNMGGYDSVNYHWGKSICVDNQYNVYFTGVYSGINSDFDPNEGIFNMTSNGKNDIFIMKLNSSGSFVWAKTIGGTEDDRGKCITLDNSNCIIVTGTYGNTVDFDPGSGTFELTTLSRESFILNLDAQGNFNWVKSTKGISEFHIIDNNNYIYTTGGFSGTVDFNPDEGVFNLICFGQSDIFLEKYDASGNFIWVKQMGGSSYEIGTSLVKDYSGSIYLGGTYYGTVDFDPNESISYQTSNGLGEAFVIKLDELITEVSQTVNSPNVIYPNPGNGIINLKNIEKCTLVIIYDMMGKKVLEQKFQGNKLDITFLPVGMYLIAFTGPKNLRTVEKYLKK